MVHAEPELENQRQKHWWQKSRPWSLQFRSYCRRGLFEKCFFSAFGRCRAADCPPGPADVACPRLDAAELQIAPRARQMLLVKTFGSWLCGRLRPFVCDCVFVCVARDLATVIDFSFLAAWSLKAKCVRKRVAFYRMFEEPLCLVCFGEKPFGNMC